MFMNAGGSRSQAEILGLVSVVAWFPAAVGDGVKGRGAHSKDLNQIDCKCQSPIELGQFGPGKRSDVLREHRFWNARQPVTPYPAAMFHAFVYPNADLSRSTVPIREDRCADYS